MRDCKSIPHRSNELKIFQVINNVTNSCELANIVIVDFDSEFVFADHNEISKLDRIDSEITLKLSLKCYFIAVDLELFNQQINKLFVHMFLQKINLILKFNAVCITYSSYYTTKFASCQVKYL